MGLLKTIIEQLQAQSYGTPGTPEKTAGVPAKPNTGAAWAPGTPGTPSFSNVGVAISIMEHLQFCEYSLHRLQSLRLVQVVKVGCLRWPVGIKQGHSHIAAH